MPLQDVQAQAPALGRTPPVADKFPPHLGGQRWVRRLLRELPPEVEPHERHAFVHALLAHQAEKAVAELEEPATPHRPEPEEPEPVQLPEFLLVDVNETRPVQLPTQRSLKRPEKEENPLLQQLGQFDKEVAHVQVLLRPQEVGAVLPVVAVEVQPHVELAKLEAVEQPLGPLLEVLAAAEVLLSEPPQQQVFSVNGEPEALNENVHGDHVQPFEHPGDGASVVYGALSSQHTMR